MFFRCLSRQELIVRLEAKLITPTRYNIIILLMKIGHSYTNLSSNSLHKIDSGFGVLSNKTDVLYGFVNWRNFDLIGSICNI